MGRYFNPAILNFQEAVNRKIFVDKSLLIKEINDSMTDYNKLLVVSRPRRFGKTYNAEMLNAYYNCAVDSKPLFDKLNISNVKSHNQYINKFNVLYFSMSRFTAYDLSKQSPIKWLEYLLIYDAKKTFGNLQVPIESVGDYLNAIVEKTGKRIVIIIDEYDEIFRKFPENKHYQNEFLNFLNQLFKSPDVLQDLALVYLTGIMPIMRDKTQSKLNNFRSVSMLDFGGLSDYIGFTGEEVKRICEQFGMDFNQMKHWYDGYDFGNNHNIYNPNSVVNAIMNRSFRDYWTLTSSSETIKPFIENNSFNICDDIKKLIAGESTVINPSDFNNTVDGIKSKDDVFTYFVHLGYLSFKPIFENGQLKGEVRIPNYEIEQEFSKMIANNPYYSLFDELINGSSALLNATLKGDEKTVEKELEEVHDKFSSDLTYNNEGDMYATIKMAYFAALKDYSCFREFQSGKGYADLVYIPVDPKKPAILIEIKKDKTAESGIDQIKSKNYPSRLEHYKKNLVLVGISYDSKTKKHRCKIEKVK